MTRTSLAELGQKAHRRPRHYRLVQTLLAEGDEEGLRELLELDAGALAAIEAADGLARSITDGQLDLADHLLGLGISVQGAGDLRYSAPLRAAVAADLEPGRQRELIGELLWRGADLDCDAGGDTALDQAIYARDPELLELLLSHGPAASTVRDALLADLTFRRHDRSRTLKLLERDLDLEAPTRTGLPLLWEAAQLGNVEALDLLVARPGASCGAQGRSSRGADPTGRLLEETVTFVSGSSPPGPGGLLTGLRLLPGLTVLDLLDRQRVLLAARSRAFLEPSETALALGQRLGRLRAVRARLVSLGAVPGGPTDRLAPATTGHQAFTHDPRRAGIDALIAELCWCCRGDEARVAAHLDSIDLVNVGPWTYLSVALLLCASELHPAALPDRLRGGWLEAILLRHAYGPELDAAACPLAGLDLADYPGEARAALEQKVLVARRGTSVLCVVRPSASRMVVGCATPAGLVCLGDSLVELVRAELHGHP